LRTTRFGRRATDEEDGLFEHPVGVFSSCPGRVGHRRSKACCAEWVSHNLLCNERTTACRCTLRRVRPDQRAEDNWTMVAQKGWRFPQRDRHISARSSPIPSSRLTWRPTRAFSFHLCNITPSGPRESPNCPSLLASDERFPCSLPVSSEAADVVSIARIERPPLYRGGSASTETMPVVSPLLFRARSCSYL